MGPLGWGYRFRLYRSDSEEQIFNIDTGVPPFGPLGTEFYRTEYIQTTLRFPLNVNLVVELNGNHMDGSHDESFFASINTTVISLLDITLVW